MAHFETGDILFLYTDGITEAHDSASEELGRERLKEFLVDLNGPQPAAALDQLFKRITTRDPQGDLTAVLVRFD